MGPSVTPSIVVGCFTLVGAILGTVLANHLQNRREDRRERAAVEAFLLAIRTELRETMHRYQASVGDQLRDHPDDQPFCVPFRTFEDYFIVYRGSGGNLGKVEDSVLRDAIERAYIYMAALLDTHRLTVELMDRIEANARDGVIDQETLRTALSEQTQALKGIRSEAEGHVSHAIYRIDEYLPESRDA